MKRMLKGLAAAALLCGLLLPATAFAEEGGIIQEGVPIDDILKEFNQASAKAKASSRKVEQVKQKQAELLAAIKRGDKISPEKVWEVKEEFVNVLFDQYGAFKKLRSYEYKIVGALKRVEYKIRSQERYLGSVIGEIDGLIDRYQRSLEVLNDKIRVEENVEGSTSDRVMTLKRQRRTIQYMLKAYQRFGEYASKVRVVHKNRQEVFSRKLKVFGEKLGQLPYIVQSLKGALRITHQIYHTSALFDEMPELDQSVRNFLEESGDFGFGADFEETLEVMSNMPDIFGAAVPADPAVSPEEKKELQEEFRKIEKKYRK